MAILGESFARVPLGLYVRRVAVIVQRRELRARGDTDFMHLGELRLPSEVDGQGQRQGG